MHRSPGSSAQLDSPQKAVDVAERLGSHLEAMHAAQVPIATTPAHALQAYSTWMSLPVLTAAPAATEAQISAAMQHCVIGVPASAELPAAKGGHDMPAAQQNAQQQQQQQALNQLLALAQVAGVQNVAAPAGSSPVVCLGFPLDAASLTAVAAVPGQASSRSLGTATAQTLPPMALQPAVYAPGLREGEPQATPAAAAKVSLSNHAAQHTSQHMSKAVKHEPGGDTSTHAQTHEPAPAPAPEPKSDPEAPAAPAAAAAAPAQASGGNNEPPLTISELQHCIQQVMQALKAMQGITEAHAQTYMQLWACMGERRQRQAFEILLGAMLCTQPQEAIKHVLVVLAHNSDTLRTTSGAGGDIV